MYFCGFLNKASGRMWCVNNWRKNQLWREGITILTSPPEATTLILIPGFQNKPINPPTNAPSKANTFLKNHFLKLKPGIWKNHYTSCNLIFFFLSHLASYLLMPGGSSFTTTLLLHAMRSLSVAIWLRGALWCICRTPSIWPLLRRPTFGGDVTSKPGLRRAKEEKDFSSFLQTINKI